MREKTRNHHRVDTEFLVRVTVPLGGNVHEATCLNLSESGLFVQLREPPPMGTTIQIELRLEPIERTVSVEGMVIWTRPHMPDPQFPPGAGIKFGPMPDETLGLIREVIAEQKRRLPRLSESRKQEP